MSGRVLIVDDDPGCGRVLALLVRHLGHEAAYVTSGYKALEFVASHCPDLIILDVMMPGMDGLEVLRRIRQDPRTSGLPVVMFSALADPQFRQSARNQGASDYWVKASLNFEDLEERLNPYLAPRDQPN